MLFSEAVGRTATFATGLIPSSRQTFPYSVTEGLPVQGLARAPAWSVTVPAQERAVHAV